jgi:hypothetical protein
VKCLILLFALLLLLASFAFANALGQHSVVLTWVDTDGTVTGYNIYRGTATGGCSGLPTPYATTAAKTFTDASVTPGTAYFYAIAAINFSGQLSPCSPEVKCTPRKSGELHNCEAVK